MELLKPYLASLARHALTVGAGALAARGVIQSSMTEQVVGAGMVCAGLVWSWWNASGREKLLKDINEMQILLRFRADQVRAQSRPIAALLVGLLLLGEGGHANAADLPVPRLFYKAPEATCTVAACSGWYVGANLSGLGSNVDILGQGLSNSVFAGGGLIGMHAGFQTWNGRFFAGAEASVAYDASPALTNGDRSRWFGMQVVKLGIGLSDLLSPSPAPAPSQGPINIPASIRDALISPYIVLGAAERARGTGWVNGAGAQFAIATGWSLGLEYLYISYKDSKVAPTAIIPANENMVRLSLNRMF